MTLQRAWELPFFLNQLDTEAVAAKQILDAIARVLGIARHSMDGLGVS